MANEGVNGTDTFESCVLPEERPEAVERVATPVASPRSEEGLRAPVPTIGLPTASPAGRNPQNGLPATPHAEIGAMKEPIVFVGFVPDAAIVPLDAHVLLVRAAQAATGTSKRPAVRGKAFPATDTVPWPVAPHPMESDSTAAQTGAAAVVGPIAVVEPPGPPADVVPPVELQLVSVDSTAAHTGSDTA